MESDEGRGDNNVSTTPTQDITDGGSSVEYETGGVVSGFMCHLYRRWQSRQPYDDLPYAPEFQTSLRRDSLGIEIGRRLAHIGDDIYEKHGSEMDFMIRGLNPNKDNVFKIFSTIASRTIEDGISWGRVLILLCFGFRLLTKTLLCHMGSGSLATITSTIVQVFILKKITDWIRRNGGWAASLTFNPSASNLAVTFVAATAISTVAAIIYKKCC